LDPVLGVIPMGIYITRDIANNITAIGITLNYASVDELRFHHVISFIQPLIMLFDFFNHRT
jgi:hypothetical protein